MHRICYQKSRQAYQNNNKIIYVHLLSVTIRSNVANIIFENFMVVKRASPVKVILVCEEKKRLADFFVVLITIDKRARAKKSSAKKKAKPKVKTPYKDRDYLIDIIIGSQTCGPLVFH